MHKKKGRRWCSHTQTNQRRSRGLPVKKRGRNNKYNANKCMTMHDKANSGARCALTRYEVVSVKGKNIRENIPGVSRFWANESEGESCVFAMLGMRGGRTGGVSGFVSSF